MNRKLGICANHGKCTLADRHYVIDATEEHFFCTECSMPLRPSIALPDAEGGGRRTLKIPHWALMALVMLGIVGVGGFAVWKLVGTPLLDLGATNVVLLSPATPLPGEPTGLQAKNSSNNVPAQAHAELNVSPVSQPGGSVKADAHVVLRIHGSNTIGAKLAPALVEEFMKEKGYAEIEKVPQADLEVLITGKKPNSQEREAVEIKAHGSSTAFDETAKNKKVGLLGGYCDVGMSSSPVKKEVVEKFQARNLGDLSSRAQEHVIALDGLAVIVNPNNAIEKLSVETIRKIFLREITDWATVGGAPGKINLYSRDHQSGTYDTFKSLVLSGKELDCSKGESLQCFEDSKELSAHVASDRGGIGFIGLNYVGISKPVRVGMTDTVNALAANRITIKTEDYPLGRRLFLYQNRDLKPLAADFIQFVLSNKGQDVVSAAGSVGLNLDEKERAVAARSLKDSELEKQRLLTDSAVSKAYKELIWNADRLDTPLNFRFQSGSFELDNRAFRDIGRLSTKLTDPKFSGTRLILVGFADPKGDAMTNLYLSQQRALKVKEQLEAEGLKVEIATGFGEDPTLLLDPREDDPTSLEKNRRVEVWLRRMSPELSQR